MVSFTTLNLFVRLFQLIPVTLLKLAVLQILTVQLVLFTEHVVMGDVSVV